MDINVHGECFHLVNINASVGDVNSASTDRVVDYSTIHRFVCSRFPTGPPLLVVILIVLTTLHLITQVMMYTS